MIPPHLLERIPLLADGVPGDAIYAQYKGARAQSGGLPEVVNMRRPEWVQATHDAFFQAGARVLRTNSAQANAVSLRAVSAELEERCEALNNSALALLRAAVGQQALVMGTVGELAASIPLPDRERAYAQQVVYLCDTGSDSLLLDGFTRLDEALRVLRLAHRAGDAPVMAVLHTDGRGVTPEGQPLVDGLRRLLDAECEAVGLCISADVTDLRPLVEPVLTLEAPTAVFLDGGAADALTPEAYAQRLAPLADLRVVLLGGGRHIGPAHVAALAKVTGQGKEWA